jgi:ubiquinone/menaquinone biosynthesis C-methylase UbiE
MAINYYDRIASNYDRMFYPNTSSSNHKVIDKAMRIINATRMGREQNVLELGCGTGIYTRIFAAFTTNIIAVDGSQNMLDIAKTRVKGNVIFKQADINNLLLEPVFDCIVGVYILQHVDVRNVLFRVSKMLKPGGRVAFIEPNALNPLIKWWEFKNKVSHALPRWEYVKIMKEVGFKDAKSQPFEFTPSNFNFRVNWLEKIQLVKELAGSVIITID